MKTMKDQKYNGVNVNINSIIGDFKKHLWHNIPDKKFYGAFNFELARISSYNWQTDTKMTSYVAFDGKKEVFKFNPDINAMCAFQLKATAKINRSKSKILQKANVILAFKPDKVCAYDTAGAVEIVKKRVLNILHENDRLIVDRISSGCYSLKRLYDFPAGAAQELHLYNTHPFTAFVVNITMIVDYRSTSCSIK